MVVLFLPQRSRDRVVVQLAPARSCVTRAPVHRQVVLLGDAGVGKSSLVLRFVTGSFDKYSESTIG